jgi:exonuclease SbcD
MVGAPSAGLTLGAPGEVRPGLSTLRIVHTSDIHISDDYSATRRLAGLRAVVDAVVAVGADAVLIVGDLFDCARASSLDVDDALGELSRLRVPTIVTTGNHDCLGPPSIYDRVSIEDAGGHVKFLADPAGSHLELEELRLTIWARALVDHHPGHNPLKGYGRLGDENWQVALAHGHYIPSGERCDRSSPIRQEQMTALGCDYLALGHWHRFADVSAPGVPAFYPGSPSESGGSYPSANLVTLDPKRGTRVERISFDR